MLAGTLQQRRGCWNELGGIDFGGGALTASNGSENLAAAIDEYFTWQWSTQYVSASVTSELMESPP